MRPALTCALSFLVSFVAACGGTGTDDTFLTPPPPSAAALYVDAQLGNDANDGSPQAPLRSLAEAFFRAQQGETIQLLPGVHSLGMTPMTVPEGVTVQGTDQGPDQAAPYVILNDGSGLLAPKPPSQQLNAPIGLIMAHGSTLRGVTLRYETALSVFITILQIDGDAASVESCVISHNVAGGKVQAVRANGLAARIQNTRMANAPRVGVVFEGAGGVLEQCDIDAAGTAVVCTYPNVPDLGGGGQSMGGNALRGTHAGLEINETDNDLGVEMYAENNAWTTVPLLFDWVEWGAGSGATGVDIKVRYLPTTGKIVIHLDGATVITP